MARVPYRRLLGSLLILATSTRPDLMVSVSMLSKYQADLRIKHWKTLRIVLRYFKGSFIFGIFLPAGTNKTFLTAWSNADWAWDHSNRSSRTGHPCKMNGAPVVWTSKLQSAATLSTARVLCSINMHLWCSACFYTVRGPWIYSTWTIRDFPGQSRNYSLDWRRSRLAISEAYQNKILSRSGRSVYGSRRHTVQQKQRGTRLTRWPRFSPVTPFKIIGLD